MFAVLVTKRHSGSQMGANWRVFLCRKGAAPSENIDNLGPNPQSMKFRKAGIHREPGAADRWRLRTRWTIHADLKSRALKD